jgi:hypothetical protein
LHPNATLFDYTIESELFSKLSHISIGAWLRSGECTWDSRAKITILTLYFNNFFINARTIMHSTFNFCQCPYHRRAMNMIPATSSSEGGLPVMETCRALLAILRPRKSRPHSPMPPLGCWGLGQRKLRNPTIVCFWVIGRRKGVPFRCKAYRSQGTDQAPVNTDRRNASSFQLLPDVPSSPMCLPLTWLNSGAIHHLIRSSAPHYVAIAIALEHRLDLELSHRPNLEAGIPGPHYQASSGV